MTARDTPRALLAKSGYGAAPRTEQQEEGRIGGEAVLGVDLATHQCPGNKLLRLFGVLLEARNVIGNEQPG